jgi:hypothetical protein
MSSCFEADRQYDVIKFTFTQKDNSLKTKAIARMSPKRALTHLLIEEKIELKQVTDIEGIDHCVISEIQHLFNSQED